MQINRHALLSIKRPLVYDAVIILSAVISALCQWHFWMPLGFGVSMYGAYWLFYRVVYYKKATDSKQTGRDFLELFYLVISIVLFIGTYLYSVQKLTLPAYDSKLQTQNKIPCEFTAVIEQIVPKEYGTQLYLKECRILMIDREVVAESKSVRILATAQQCAYHIGDTVRIHGKIKKFDGTRNEGEFDARQYYASIGILYQVSVTKMDCIQENTNRILQGIGKVKQYLSQSYQTIAMQEDVGLLHSMVLGDKSQLSADVKQLYQKNGISHLLAISGLHISLIGMTVFRLLRKLNRTYVQAALGGTALVLSYGILTGNTVSTRRAVMMMIIMFGAEVCGRTYDIKSALAFAAIVLVYDNPYVLYNSAFWLSFGAIIGICVISPVLLEFFMPFTKQNAQGKCSNKQQWVRRCVQALLVSISVSIITFPIILYNYYEFPLYSVLLNIVVVPCMSLFMMCAWCAGIVGGLIPQAGIFLIGTSHYILWFYEKVCTLTQELPYATIVTGKPSLVAVIGYYMIIFLGLTVYRLKCQYHKAIERSYYRLPADEKEKKQMQYCLVRYSKYKRYRLELLLGLTLAAIILIYRPVRGFVVDMIDVGQGDGIFVQTPKRVTYLFDGGSTDIKQVAKYRIMPFLKSKGVTKIDYVFISHSDADHINGILEMIEQQEPQIGCIVLPGIRTKETDKSYMNIEEQANKYKIPIQYANAGQQIDKLITCVHPTLDYAYEDANDYSATYLVQYGKFRMLMTGDAGEHAENAMRQSGMLSDISLLKVGHHGSKTSSSEVFLDAVTPEIALISCGIDNRYGHPATQTLQALEKRNIDTYITARQGQITVRTDGQQMWIQTKQ